MDIYFQAAGRRVAVEVDGPSHFTTSEPRRLLGPSLARNACLRALGLALVPLAFSDYQQWPPARRGPELRALVEAAVGLVEEAAPPRSRAGVKPSSSARSA